MYYIFAHVFCTSITLSHVKCYAHALFTKESHFKGQIPYYSFKIELNWLIFTQFLPKTSPQLVIAQW